MTDENVLKNAFEAENGPKFKRLWEGDITGYESASEADMALCNILSFWTCGSREQIERMFSRSSLGKREKWKRESYRDQVIESAVVDAKGLYKPLLLNRLNQANSPIKEQAVEMVCELAQNLGRAPDWDATFRLARRLRRLTDRNPEQFQDALRLFCEKTGRPTEGDRWEEFYTQFQVIWEKIEKADGDDPVDWAIDKAKETPYPLEKSPGRAYTEIAGLAWHLSKLTHGKPFFLGRDKLARALNGYPMLITRAIQLLELHKILRCVKEEYKRPMGGKKGLCKEYVFIGQEPC